MAEKGDKSAYKQGSSSEEKIESGKAEVVKPEENPVDKAVAAANKASDGTKPVKDAVNKNAEKGDSKADKLKEDEDSNEEDTIAEKGQSKMELIKAAVDSMKGLNKEELNKLFSSLSEDEVDESLTKAEVARKIVEALKEMSKKSQNSLKKWVMVVWKTKKTKMMMTKMTMTMKKSHTVRKSQNQNQSKMTLLLNLH